MPDPAVVETLQDGEVDEMLDARWSMGACSHVGSCAMQPCLGCPCFMLVNASAANIRTSKLSSACHNRDRGIWDYRIDMHLPFLEQVDSDDRSPNSGSISKPQNPASGTRHRDLGLAS